MPASGGATGRRGRGATSQANRSEVVPQVAAVPATCENKTHDMGAFRCAAACEMQAWLARSKCNAKTSTAAYPTESFRRHRSARSSSSGRTACTRDLPSEGNSGQPNQTHDSWHSHAPEAERQLPLLPRLHLPSGQFSSGRSRKITSRKAGRTRSHARTFTSEATTCQTNARGQICDRLSRLAAGRAIKD